MIYLYCVTKTLSDLKGLEEMVNSGATVQAEREEICFLDCAHFYAVASKVSPLEFSEENLKKNLADFEWVKKKTIQHEKVIETVMHNTCVIPFKFATLFISEENLKASLSERAQELLENLENLEGKEEWGVKIYCDMEKLKKSALQEEPELLKVEQEIQLALEGKAFFLKKKKEGLIQRLIVQKINQLGQESFEHLSKVSLHNSILKLLPKEVTEKDEEMILNAAFLVDKNRISSFMEVIDTLKSRGIKNDSFLALSGPWPPYHFC